MKKILLIIPAYNEEKNIVKTVMPIKELNLENYQIDYIVINDGSTDKTKEICQNEKFNFLDLSSNLGIGGAVQTGYKYALKKEYDIAIQFDGDNQHDIAYLKDLVEMIENGYDLVIGSRFVSELSEFKSSFLRRVGISFLSWLIKVCTKEKIYDVTSGYRACNKKLISYFAKVYPTDYPEPDSLVQVLKKGYKVKEIPVKMRSRENGKSSIKGFKSIYYMIKVSFAIILADLASKED
ncbi:MAG: glycosyltransferase family 2 protein [Firmicutes bacterium]|nr:glycosyltransferase family 2 protein [Bacillota bacterium]